jgi:RNA 3'-terminal phosphate cyclase (ATP)
LTGDALHSGELTFKPGPVKGGQYTFDIGSAGSTTLVFQTVLPALLLARETSVLTFTGGTHNHGGPPWDFLSRVFHPALAAMGAALTIDLQRHGFAPGGEGRWSARIHPSKLKPLTLHTRGALQTRDVQALVSNLPMSIADRELAIVRKHLSWAGEAMHGRFVEATGPGNIVLIGADYAHVSEMATGFGRRGFPAEKVAMEAVDCWRAYEETEAPVGEHLADQLLLPIALAGKGSFNTVKPTLHTRTNAEVIAKFLPTTRFQIEATAAPAWNVSLG